MEGEFKKQIYVSDPELPSGFIEWREGTYVISVDLNSDADVFRNQALNHLMQLINFVSRVNNSESSPYRQLIVENGGEFQKYWLELKTFIQFHNKKL